MYQKIGFRNLFHDLAEVTFIGVLLLSILVYGAISIRNNYLISEERIYTYIFIISPLYYLITNVFSFINMKENNTFETEMVCKYNLYQVSALRMMVFSMISIILSIMFILGLYHKINMLKGIMISLSSIFLFSAMLLCSMLKIRSPIIKYMVIGGWLIVNGLLFRLSSNHYFVFLETIPTMVYLIVTILSAWIYIKNIKILSNYKKVVGCSLRIF